MGQVFAGQTLGGNSVAVKHLYILPEAGAHRELAVVEQLSGRNFDHIVPLLDGGEDANGSGYFVVMAKAEESLKDAIGHRRFDAQAAAEVLLEITSGLLEVGELVHRDLKPANVLRHEYEMSYVRTDTPIGQMPVQCVQYRDADLAVAGTVMSSYGVAFGPEPIDDEDEEQFQQRWIHLFALAASGRLRHPAQFPVKWPLVFV